MPSNDAVNTNCYTISQTDNDVIGTGNATLVAGEMVQASPVLHSDHGTIAYELLLLQQRLAAYERLHLEEIAELRREIERLSRVFLQQPPLRN